jgi:uncharacterized protein
MMRTFAAALGLMAALTTGASAQTIGLATTQGGATEQIATALARTISAGTELQVRPQVLANTSQYLPLVDSGRVEFGIANFPQTANAIEGVGMSDGQPNPNIVMVASLIPFNAGLMASVESGIETPEDLAGKRVPRFPPNSLGDFIISATLEAGGLTYDDVTSVPMSNFPSMFQAIKDGQTDVTIASVGSQPTFDIEATLGPVRFIDYAEDDAEILAAALPGTQLKSWAGLAEAPGVSNETVIFFYDYTLFANKDVDAAVVTEVVRALYEGTESLQSSGPLWGEYDPARLASVTTLPYHPAAQAFYEEAGIWGGE